MPVTKKIQQAPKRKEPSVVVAKRRGRPPKPLERIPMTLEEAQEKLNKMMRDRMDIINIKPTKILMVPPIPVSSALDTQVAGDHYKNFTIQPVEFIMKNRLSFLEGCVIKRVCRHRAKNGAEDIRKAIHELQLILELEYPDA